MNSDISNILTDQFKRMLMQQNEHQSFWIPEPSSQDHVVRKKILRSAIFILKSTSAKHRLPVRTTKVLATLHHINKQSPVDDEDATNDVRNFKREGYEVMVTSKQRLFIRSDEEDAIALLNDRRSLGSKLVILNLSPATTEADIVPKLEKFGTVTSVRIPLHPETKECRGHAFVTFSRMDEAAAAAKYFVDSQLLTGVLTGPCRRLFVRHIPRNKDAAEVHRMFRQMLPGLVKITLFPIGYSAGRVRAGVRNVGYAFLEFQNSHYAKLSKTIISIMQVLGSDLAADWADPLNPEYQICDASGDE